MLKFLSKITESLRSGSLRPASEHQQTVDTRSTASLVAELRAKNKQLLATKETLEATLKKSHRTQSLLDATINSTASGVVVADMQVNFILINPPGRRMLGKLSELGPSGWNESLGIFKNEEGRLFREDELPLGRACRGEVVERMEMFVRNGTDHGPLWVEANATQIVGIDGKPRGAVTVFNDITAERQSREGLRDLQRQTASELADSNRTLEEVLSTIPEAIWRGVQGKDSFKFTYFSPGIERIVGIAPHLLTDGTQFFETRVHKDDREGIRNLMLKISKGKSTDSEVEYRLIHADGSIRWIRNQMRAVIIGQSHVVQGIMTDITKERDTKLNLNRAERLVSIGTLAAGIAHEINNPLQVMMLKADSGHVQLMNNAFSEDAATSLLEDIKRQINRCSEIVSGVLQFTGDTSTKRQAISLDMIVKDSINLIRFKAVKQKIEIQHRSCENGDPLADVNGVEIGQVVINFLANAIDASPDRSAIEVIVRIEGDRIKVSVIDNGHGMDVEAMNSAFDPFYTTKRGLGGTGLGLSLSDTIVKNHGGEIWIEETALEQGTTISFWLPRSEHPNANSVNAN